MNVILKTIFSLMPFTKNNIGVNSKNVTFVETPIPRIIP